MCVTLAACGRAAAPHARDAPKAMLTTDRAIVSQVFACRMPSAPDPPLDPVERAALLAWLVCGAENN